MASVRHTGASGMAPSARGAPQWSVGNDRMVPPPEACCRRLRHRREVARHVVARASGPV